MVEEFNSEAASKKFLNVLPIRQEGLLSKKGQFYGMVPLSLSLVERSDMGLSKLRLELESIFSL